MDFSKFYATNATESNFKETFTIEEIKAAENGAAFQIAPSKSKEDKAFFACGRIRGYVAQKTWDKIKAKEPVNTLLVSHVVGEDGFDGLMLHESNSELIL